MTLTKEQRNALRRVYWMFETHSEHPYSRIVYYSAIFPKGKNMRKNMTSRFKEVLRKGLEKRGCNVHFNSYRDSSMYVTVKDSAGICGDAFV